jgi:hypothetical protein
MTSTLTERDLNENRLTGVSGFFGEAVLIQGGIETAPGTVGGQAHTKTMESGDSVLFWSSVVRWIDGRT